MDMTIFVFLSLFLCVPVAEVASQLSNDADELLNYCLDGKFHKHTPSREHDVWDHCSPWQERSCCSEETTLNIRNEARYGFTYNHCSAKSNMSSECQRYFHRELCFYECSPNTGPWARKVDMKIRKEKYYDVPLCASDCDAWFHACRLEFTCVKNWGRDFQWEDGQNRCPEGSKCMTYQEIYENSKEFCEQVFDYNWKYTSDQLPCMKLWFDPRLGNPNDVVAKIRVDQLLSPTSTNAADGSGNYCLIVSLIVALLTILLS